MFLPGCRASCSDGSPSVAYVGKHQEVEPMGYGIFLAHNLRHQSLMIYLVIDSAVGILGAFNYLVTNYISTNLNAILITDSSFWPDIQATGRRAWKTQTLSESLTFL